MNFVYITPEARANAKNVSLDAFMRAEYPFETKIESETTSRWRKDSSVVFTDRGYYRNSQTKREYDDPIGFLMKYKGLSYVEAVTRLNDFDSKNDTRY